MTGPGAAQQRQKPGLAGVVATLCGAGYSPVAPGTAGSAVAAAAYLLAAGGLGTAGWVALLSVSFAVGVHTAQVTARRRLEHDPGVVVIDEGVGYLVTVAFLPHGLGTAVAGFLVFRALDIVKPPPARWCEGAPGGWGIVLDDVVAGIYGNLLLWAGWRGLAWLQAG
ncbi:MAG: phosphatidylglycerophosphatase A [Candidatus Latescibacterota bacterium]